MIEISSLASGSSGNCFYIGTNKSNILIDAGISCKQIKSKLESIGKDISNLDAVFITHEHSDHIRGIDVISRKYNLPIYVNKGTLKNCFFDMGNINFFKTDKEITINDLSILPFNKSHDAGEPVSYLIKKGSKKVSVITDIGYSCNNVKQAISESDFTILESNHDLKMLKEGPYPYFLKKRIAGKEGHLSNYDAALLVLEHANKNLKHVMLSHLSLNNNTPELALNTFNTIVKERADLKNIKTEIASKEKTTGIVRVE